MSKRKYLIAGNWKMNESLKSAKALANEVKDISASNFDHLDILVCPPFPLLLPVLESITGSNVDLGAQDCHFNEKGAHTGDTSAVLLKDIGCKYTIVGHSERRADHAESNEIVKQKAKAAIDAGLIAVICIGETLAEKNAGKTIEVNADQVRNSMPEGANASNVVVAYEPVWAIGSGLIPETAEIQETHKAIRLEIAKVLGESEAEGMRILYGGSMKPSNAEEILALDDVDGGLVGGASLNANDFLAIAEKAK